MHAACGASSGSGGTWKWQCGARVCVGRSEVLTTMWLQICVLGVVALCHWVCSSCSVGLYCFHFQLLALCCSEMLGTAHPTYSLGSSHVACCEPLSHSLLFILISAVSRTRQGLLMRSSLSLSLLNNCIHVLSPCLSLNYIAFLNCTIQLQVCCLDQA